MNQSHIKKIINNIKLFEKLANFNLNAYSSDSSQIIKQAFDTRRINQETEINPRRGLQYYQRRDKFISDTTSKKINTFYKLKCAVDEVKGIYLGAPEWLDSNCRILSEALNRILRIDQKDFDFSDPHLDYLEELVDLRYRLKLNDIDAFGSDKLKEILLNKDERLVNTVLYNNYNDKQQEEIKINSIDNLIANLLKTVKADGNQEAERSIIITVKDKVVK